MVGATMAERTRSLKDLGDEHLNVQFGWLPLISDVRSLAHSVKDANRIIDAHVRGSDKKIRRRMAFPSKTETTSTRNASVTLGGGLGSPTGWSSTVTETIQWFSGCFKYHIPIGDNLSDRLVRYEAQANLLLGTRLTPSVVWELAPWSWAVDWVSNVGDVMTNVSAFSHDGLAMQYGYMMEHKRSECTFGWTGPMKDGATGQNRTFSAVSRFTSETKKRREATPYGFGLNIDGFSTRQWSILMALGIARAPGSLAKG
jgi:hypothetical protein